MKKYISIIFTFGFLLLSFQSCSSQNKVDSQAVASLVNAEEFTFHAERANPMNYDVINILNAIPNATSARMLNLDGNYTIELKNNELDVMLPYFGRSFNADYSGDNSYRFTSKDFIVNKSLDKKGNWIVKIKPNDVRNVNEIIIEISKNGKALTSMRSNDRQPISYDGYISKNESSKP